MKGDDTRAELLAAMLDGGPVADEIEPFVPAVRRVRQLLDQLAPDPARVAAVVPRLLERVSDAPRLPVLELAHPTVAVSDMETALTFYRDALGLTVRVADKWFATLDAGGARLALQWTGPHRPRPQIGDIRLEFHTRGLDRLVETLRDGDIPVRIKADPHRRRYAELHDPDGHTVWLFEGGDQP